MIIRVLAKSAITIPSIIECLLTQLTDILLIYIFIIATNNNILVI